MYVSVAHSPAAIGNFGGLLEDISIVAHQACGNKIDNIPVVRAFIIVYAIKHHSGSLITIGNIFWSISISDQSYMLISNIILYY